MAAANSIPRFREKTYTGKNGQTYTYYSWDGRGRGMKDIRLGSDREAALKRWDECERGLFSGSAKPAPSRMLKQRTPGRRRRAAGTSWEDQPDWVRRMFYNAERRAQVSRKSFTLSPASFLEVVSRAGGACEISGIEFDTSCKGGPYFPSIDRVDNVIGYEPHNIRIVCHVANVAMNTWGLEPVLRLVKAIIAPTT